MRDLRADIFCHSRFFLATTPYLKVIRIHLATDDFEFESKEVNVHVAPTLFQRLYIFRYVNSVLSFALIIFSCELRAAM